MIYKYKHLKQIIKNKWTTENKWTIKTANHRVKKTIKRVKQILECFVCEKFTNEKFYEKLDRDKIALYSIYKSMKGLKRIHRIAISRDMISLNTEKQTKIRYA